MSCTCPRLHSVLRKPLPCISIYNYMSSPLCWQKRAFALYQSNEVVNPSALPSIYLDFLYGLTSIVKWMHISGVYASCSQNYLAWNIFDSLWIRKTIIFQFSELHFFCCDKCSHAIWVLILAVESPFFIRKMVAYFWALIEVPICFGGKNSQIILYAGFPITFCNLGQIHFAIWDKYILQFETNTFD